METDCVSAWAGARHKVETNGGRLQGYLSPTNSHIHKDSSILQLLPKYLSYILSPIQVFDLLSDWPSSSVC